ncbi:hypothetical protein [Actinomadura madurae]|uniref:hypothetical protein n=1 Tax=Actinomadura madurae TaxID=1993 RepID=UPI0020D232A0|nr:hypothetical protein [Actinomadura madurae]MCP9948347.1 hypothetical protein [Actinomadura madurae]MCP9965119.1 hypothetical protein [Actinomadura madurae]MCP9977611.1 hypothetical protein [Actinomadura madurae]MCQ0010895.1 hypothetical protein [Actinomadura madurae]MCQ0013799.1 hypothetical protein [Actinomadura madurae]
MVKVVANLDLPGALSITDAPRGPRSACDQRRSRWNQLSAADGNVILSVDKTMRIIPVASVKVMRTVAKCPS